MPPLIPQKALPYVLFATVALAALLPLTIALYLAYNTTRQGQIDTVSQMAQQVLQRTDDTTSQMFRAARELGNERSSDPCSPQAIERMRRALIHSYMLTDVGHVSGDKLDCSALGLHDVPIGPPYYRSARDYWIRRGVLFPGAPDTPLIASTDPATGNTVFVNEGTVLNAMPIGSNWIVAIVGQGQRNLVVAQRGDFDPRWLDAMTPATTGHFRDARYVVAWQRSAHGAYATIAALPLGAAGAHWIKDNLGPGALGLGIGALLALALVRLVRMNASPESFLRQAIKGNELSLAYQPVVEMATGRWTGAEALLRWRRPNGESVSPGIFIPLAEKAGLMPAIRERLLSLFERDARELFARHPAFHVALNFSADDFAAPDLPARLMLAIERTGAKSHNLHAEITESRFMSVANSSACVEALHRHGIALALDDFGTGYSSLAYLTQMKFDFLKIDKSFVDTIGKNAVTSSIVDHIIEMAKSIDVGMIAEGVETEEQARYLQAHGVRYAQGWLYCKAIPMDELLTRLRQMQVQPAAAPA